uniref:MRG domain-containing protein n=1 Tax=Caenorhabditis tropicalis TaxID=1561998 RepID=A0A1I7UVP5_9PELO
MKALIPQDKSPDSSPDDSQDCPPFLQIEIPAEFSNDCDDGPPLLIPVSLLESAPVIRTESTVVQNPQVFWEHEWDVLVQDAKWKKPIPRYLVEAVEELDVFVKGNNPRPKYTSLPRVDGFLKLFLLHFIDLPRDLQPKRGMRIEIVASRMMNQMGKVVDPRLIERIFETLKRQQARFSSENEILFEGLEEFNFNFVSMLPIHSLSAGCSFRKSLTSSE